MQRIKNQLIVLAVGILVTALLFQSTLAGPCTPCSTWGSVKSCWTNNPDPCCSCGKDIQLMGIAVTLYAKSYYTVIETNIINLLKSKSRCDCHLEKNVMDRGITINPHNGKNEI